MLFHLKVGQNRRSLVTNDSAGGSKNKCGWFFRGVGGVLWRLLGSWGDDDPTHWVHMPGPCGGSLGEGYDAWWWETYSGTRKGEGEGYDDMIWCDVMWCDMIWYDITWYDDKWIFNGISRYVYIYTQIPDSNIAELLEYRLCLGPAYRRDKWFISWMYFHDAFSSGLFHQETGQSNHKKSPHRISEISKGDRAEYLCGFLVLLYSKNV